MYLYYDSETPNTTEILGGSLGCLTQPGGDQIREAENTPWKIESVKMYIITHTIHVWFIYLHLPYFTIKNQPNVGEYAIHVMFQVIKPFPPLCLALAFVFPFAPLKCFLLTDFLWFSSWTHKGESVSLAKFG